jgi:uncharacterized protein (DUF488 family)
MDKLLGLLQEQCIELVLDVRSVPYSQYTKQFNRENLVYALKKTRIDYQHSGDELGGRPQDPELYKSGNAPRGKADYLHTVDYETAALAPRFVETLTRVVETARSRRTAILCSEEDPNRCHRHHLIARCLVRQGVKVMHIRGDGRIERAWPTGADFTLTEPAVQPVLF